MEERTHSGATISRCLAAVRSFFKFAHSEGFLKGNPSESLTTPGFNKPLPRTLSKENVVLLLEQPAKQSTPAALRDTAMMELVYATGVRVTELVSLDLDHFSMDRKTPCVNVCGGAKDRSIPIHQQAIRALIRYLNEGRPSLLRTETERALFLNRTGGRMTRQGFWLVLKQHGKDAKTDGTVTPHTLRHSFASHMLSGGATLEDVQEMLGHANISTTQVYMHIKDEHIRRVYEKAHPRTGL